MADAGWSAQCARAETAGGPRTRIVETRGGGLDCEARAFVVHWSQDKGAWLDDLPHGPATVEPGRITDYEAGYKAGEANCCPSTFLVSTVWYSGGSFRLVLLSRVAPGSGPPRSDSDL